MPATFFQTVSRKIHARYYTSFILLAQEKKGTCEKKKRQWIEY